MPATTAAQAPVPQAPARTQTATAPSRDSTTPSQVQLDEPEPVGPVRGTPSPAAVSKTATEANAIKLRKMIL